VLTRHAASGPGVLPNSIAVVDTARNRVVGDIRIHGSPVAIAAGPSGVYVASEREGIVWRIDAATRRVVKTLGVGADVHDLAVGFGSVWVADGTDGTVTRIDDHLRIQKRIPLGRPQPDAPAFWIATGAGGVWVTRGNSVVEIDPATNHVIRRFATPYPSGLAVGLGSAWVTSGRQLFRVKPGKGVTSVTRDAIPQPVLAPTVGHAALWSIVYNDLGELWRISPNGDASVVGGVGRYPLDVSVGNGATWTIDTRGVVTRVDTLHKGTNVRIATAPTIRSALATTKGALWVAIERPT
jgi:hypothetical protein